MALTLRRVIVLLAALATTAATARLGWWQLDRAAQKQQIQALQDARHALPPLTTADLGHDGVAIEGQLHRRIVLEGHWLPGRTIYLENRQMNDRPGFYAVTPLDLGDAGVVLVQRGWLPRDPADRTHITAPPPPEGLVRLHGRIAGSLSRMFEFSAAASGAIRQNLDIGAFARETSLPLRPLAVVQEEDAGHTNDGLLRNWPPAASDLPKHYGYAVQWFAMSALALGLYVWFQLLRPVLVARRR